MKSTPAMRARIRELMSNEQDDYDRAVECVLDDFEALEAVLRQIIDSVHDYERVNNLAPTPPRTECWDSIAHAIKVLAGSQDK
jgi:hypothetical protein